MELKIGIIGVSKAHIELSCSNGFTIKCGSGAFDIEKLNNELQEHGIQPLREVEKCDANQ